MTGGDGLTEGRWEGAGGPEMGQLSPRVHPAGHFWILCCLPRDLALSGARRHQSWDPAPSEAE